jgi:hypothetical protein
MEEIYQTFAALSRKEEISIGYEWLTGERDMKSAATPPIFQ